VSHIAYHRSVNELVMMMLSLTIPDEG